MCTHETEHIEPTNETEKHIEHSNKQKNILNIQCFHLVPVVPEFYFSIYNQNHVINWYESEIPWAESWYVDKVLGVISRFCASPSAIGCTFEHTFRNSRTNEQTIYNRTNIHKQSEIEIHAHIIVYKYEYIYGVAMMSKLLKMIGLFCKRAL